MLKLSVKKIILLFILINPFLDIIYSINFSILKINLPINQLIRTSMIPIFLLMIKKKKNFLLIFSFGIALLLGEIYHAYNSIEFDIFENMGYSLKILYLIISILALEEMIERKDVTKLDLMHYSVLSSYIISGSIILSKFTGIGFSTYGSRLGGFKGLFTVQNTVNASLLILLPLALYMYSKIKEKKYLFAAIFIFISLFILGTKSGLFGAIIIFVLNFGYYLKNKALTIKKMIVLIFGLLFSGLLVILLSKFFISFINGQLNLYYQYGYVNFESFLLSNRTLQIQYLDTYLKYNSSDLTFLFGIGYSTANFIIHKGKSNFQAIEMDFHGLYYYSGIIILLPISYFILKRFYKILKNWLFLRNDKRSFYIFLSISTGIMHAYLGGHVLYEAQTIIYLAIVLSLGKNLKEY